MSSYRESRRRGEWNRKWSRDDDESKEAKRYRVKLDDLVVIDYEGNGVPQDSPDPVDNLLELPIYEEDGFVLSAIQSKGAFFPPLGITLADINLRAPDLSPNANEVINEVSQFPGRTVAVAEEPESDLVITRKDGEDFKFKGGFFGFIALLDSVNTQESVSLAFKGYRNGRLVDSFASKVPKGNFIRSRIREDIDMLVIEDGDLLGFAATDNLMFEV